MLLRKMATDVKWGGTTERLVSRQIVLEARDSLEEALGDAASLLLDLLQLVLAPA